MGINRFCEVSNAVYCSIFPKRIEGTKIIIIIIIIISGTTALKMNLGLF
jgi:hypothetical protein